MATAEMWVYEQCHPDCNLSSRACAITSWLKSDDSLAAHRYSYLISCTNRYPRFMQSKATPSSPPHLPPIIQGGKDSASARYIFTRLGPLTRKLFRTDDEPLLEFKYEEGQKIEPAWYLPILPTILVNGCDGIGTGYST